jgi:hypothetical protein
MAYLRLKYIVAILILVLLLVAGFHVFRVSPTKPSCNCMFPNSNRYGVITNGRCIEVRCDVRKQ